MKTLVLESLFNKVVGLKVCKFIKKRLQQRCIPVKFGKFLRIPFLAEHFRLLLLELFCEKILRPNAQEKAPSQRFDWVLKTAM